jgi:hypothetical protein
MTFASPAVAKSASTISPRTAQTEKLIPTRPSIASAAAPSWAPFAHASESGYASREAQAKQLEKFKGGGTAIYLSSSAAVLVVVLLVLLIVF